MTSTTALGLCIRLSMFELRETGDWDIFQGHPERACRAPCFIFFNVLLPRPKVEIFFLLLSCRAPIHST